MAVELIQEESSYPLPSCGGTPPILRETAEMERKNQRMSSYPLPSYGGTPPILRGEHHAEYSYTINTK